MIGLMIAALAAFFLLIMADIWMYGNVDEKQDADVIIVLGAAAYESGVTPVFAERINHAADLLKQGYADQIILTGNYGIDSESYKWVEVTVVSSGLQPAKV